MTSIFPSETFTNKFSTFPIIEHYWRFVILHTDSQLRSMAHTSMIYVTNLSKLTFCIITDISQYLVQYTTISYHRGFHITNRNNINWAMVFRPNIGWIPLLKKASQGTEIYWFYLILPLAKHLKWTANNKTRQIRPGRSKASGTQPNLKPVGE